MVRNTYTGRFGREYKIDQSVFDEDTEQAAYWGGFLYADGCVSGDELILMLSSRDKDHMEKFKIFLKSDMPISERLVASKYSMSRFAIRGKQLTSGVKRYGVTSPRKPFFPFASDHIKDWIRGFFDGDGSVSRNKRRISLVGDYAVLSLIQLELHGILGVGGSLYKHTVSDIYYLEYCGRRQCSKIIQYLYQDSTVWLDRKKREAEKFLEEPQPRQRNKKGQYI
jgi:hypothetical protein